MMVHATQNLYGRLVTASLLCAVAVIVVEVYRNRQGQAMASRFVKSTPAGEHSPDPLKVRLGEVDLPAVPLGRAIRLLADRSGANLDCDWAALHWNHSTGVEEVAISPTLPVTLYLHNPTLEEVLEAICRQVNPQDDQHLGIGRDPAGLLLLGIAEDDGSERSVTTSPRFYNVDDLLGPPAVLQASVAPQERDYGALHPHACRPELNRLATVLDNFAGSGRVGCFGRWLMVNGYSEAQTNVAAILDRIRHPIRLSKATTRAMESEGRRHVLLSLLPSIAVFRVPPEGMSGRDALKKWEAAGHGHAVIGLTDQELDGLPDVVGFELHDASLEQIAAQIVGSPFIVVPQGMEDDCVHVRRGREVQIEGTPRAYDVSAILSRPEGWIKDADWLVGASERLDNGELLIRLISSHLAVHCDFQFPYRSPSDRQVASYWNGILLIQAPSNVHLQIAEFLEHLQRTGRPYDPPTDQ
jgi:hypothetical protein